MTLTRRSLQAVIMLILPLLTVYGCTAIGEQKYDTQLFKSQLTIFLNGPDKVSQDISFNLAAVNIISEDGTAREIISTPRTINSIAVEGRQLLLAERMVPEGKYKKIQLIVTAASLNKMDKTASLALPEEGIQIDVNISVKGYQNTTLFLNWDADASIHDKYMFKPVFTVKDETPELSSLLIYVTNEEANNVSVINRRSGEVTATIMTGKRPRGIAVSGSGERSKVYVANSGSNSVSVIDPTTNKIETEVPIRFGSGPEGIAVARISSDKHLVFVANYRSNNVSVVDAATFQEIEKIDVGNGPIAIAVDPPAETLAGSRYLSFEDAGVLNNYRNSFFNVYVLNQNSNTVSVIRMDKLTQRSAEIITLNVEWRPAALDIDYQRGKVYVANYSSDKLSVIDIVKTVKGITSGAVSTINNVGASIIGVISDPDFDRIYLLKETEGTIMIIRPFGKGFDNLNTIMPPVMGSINVGKAPRSFALDPEKRKFYVVNRGSDSISVVDRTSKKEEEVIPVGRKPYGIAVFEK